MTFSQTPSMLPRSTSAPGQLNPLWEAQGMPDVMLQALQEQSPMVALPSLETIFEPLLHQDDAVFAVCPVAGQPCGSGPGREGTAS